MPWLGPIPPMRDERHYGDRVLRCFADRPAGLCQMLDDAVRRNPRGEALVGPDRRLDYASLQHAAARTAGGLGRLGIGQGDRVALLLSNRIEFVVAVLAIMRVGAIAVLLNIREERPELAYILAHCGAAALIHDGELEPRIPDARDVPDLAHRIALGASERATCCFEDLASGPPAPAAVIAEEDVAAILYTSGTTGRPKGAMLTHLSIGHAAMIYEACMGLGPGERSIVSVPMSHVTGLTAAIGAMLRVAGTLIVMPAFKAEAFVALAQRERMTHTVMVPAMYNLCLMAPAFASADLTSWRIGGYGGAPMPEVTIARLAERLPRLRLMNAYGSTETTGPVVLMPPGESIRRREAVGRAVPVAEIRVMDSHGRELAAGETGEVWLRSPNVVPGYWGDPQATRESFVGGYWRSGDIGRLDGEGYLTLLDRAKDMINRGGFKIYSVEVENVLASHPDVVEAAVVAKPCPVLGERVHAFIVPRARPADAADLRAYCQGKLADYKIPESVTCLDMPLPRNANGKVMKRDLRERARREGL